MRVVVVGATGNVGTSVLRALGGDDRVDELVGVARRLPALELPKTAWEAADVERDELVPLLRGADCVVHLAWRIQPSHDVAALRRTNVDGSARLFRAVAEAGVPALVHASSVGAYSPGPKDPTSAGPRAARRRASTRATRPRSSGSSTRSSASGRTCASPASGRR